ncbi:hypothetical protein DCC62_17625 [candidate division KSB1 bacterium]|nr:MAG: hypothetical protein DCC62_17625 [candidate division KSB1 bacterium]
MNEKQLLQHLKRIVEEVEQAPNAGAINNLKQIKGGENYYRIRIGNYRIGLNKGDRSTEISAKVRHEILILAWQPKCGFT